MNINNIMIGADRGSMLVEQRQQKEEVLKRQQETHNSNMQKAEQIRDANDIKIQQAQTELNTIKKQLSRKEFDEAFKTFTNYKDSTLLKKWALEDPEGNKILGNPVDIKTATELNAFDGIEDEILLQNDFKEQDLAKMTPEQKVEAIHNFGDDVLIMSLANGHKVVTSADELAAKSGYLSRVAEKDKQEYNKAVIAGGLKRAYALALYKGDKELAERYKQAILSTQSVSKSTTNISKPTSKMKEGAFIAEAQGIDPNSAEGKQIIANHIESTAKQKNDAYAQQKINASKDVISMLNKATTPNEINNIIGSDTFREAYAAENDLLKKDKASEKLLSETNPSLDAIGSFGQVVQAINSGKVKDKNAITNSLDAISSKMTFKDSYKWDINDKTTIQTDAKDYVARSELNVKAQTATLALIKAMSGLAVTDDERKLYKELLKTGNLDDIHGMLIAAESFIDSKKDLILNQIDRVSGLYPAHASLIKSKLQVGLNSIKIKDKPEATVVDTKAEEANIVKSLYEMHKRSK